MITRFLEYGKAARVYFWLPTYTDAKDAQTSPAFAAGDVKISKDGAALANTATAVHVASGLCYVDLTAVELTAKQAALVIIDQTGTKVWPDFAIYLETYGHPSAMDPADVLAAGQAQAVAINSITLAAATISANGQFQDSIVEITGSTGTPTAVGQQRFINSTNATTQVAVLERDWQILPSGTVTYKIIKSPAGGNAVDISEIAGDPAAAIALRDNIANLDEAVSSLSTLQAADVSAAVDAATSIVNLLSGAHGSFDGYNMAQSMKLLLAIAVGRLSGADLNTLSFKAANNPATTRVVITTDATGRTGVTITV
jgi:hypothetical protein